MCVYPVKYPVKLHSYGPLLTTVHTSRNDALCFFCSRECGTFAWGDNVVVSLAAERGFRVLVPKCTRISCILIRCLIKIISIISIIEAVLGVGRFYILCK